MLLLLIRLLGRILLRFWIGSLLLQVLHRRLRRLVRRLGLLERQLGLIEALLLLRQSLLLGVLVQ